MTEQDFNPQLEIGIQRSSQEELQMKRKYLSDILSLGDTLIKGKGLKPDEDGYYSLEIIASNTHPNEGFLQACTQAKARGIIGIDIVQRGSRKIEGLPAEEQKDVETYAEKFLVAWNPDHMIESVSGYSQATVEVTQNQAEEQQEDLWADERNAKAKLELNLFLSAINSSNAPKRKLRDGWFQGEFLPNDNAVQKWAGLNFIASMVPEIDQCIKVRDTRLSGQQAFQIDWHPDKINEFIKSK